MMIAIHSSINAIVQSKGIGLGRADNEPIGINCNWQVLIFPRRDFNRIARARINRITACPLHDLSLFYISFALSRVRARARVCAW